MTYKNSELRIDEELARTLAELRSYLTADDPDQWEADNGQPIEPLNVERKVVVTWQMSWGGPSDEFEIHIDPEDKTITEIYYVYKDWFDGARRPVLDDDFNDVAGYFETYIEYWLDMTSWTH